MIMTGIEKTMLFLKGDGSEKPPFHPIIMRWAAKYAGIRYRDFCTVPEAKCYAMLRCARDFGIDWVTVMSDPWAEASGFGIEIDYPEDTLPVDKGGHLPDAASAALIKPYNILDNERCRNRIDELKIFKKEAGNELLIVGWVEGPVAEYVDLRGATNAAVDLLTEPESVARAMDMIIENAREFISLQIRAGAHCIGIGDAFCSQIGPELYYHYAFEREKELIDHIHSEGALAKLHICGNTESIVEGMIRTGADIIDIDHLVPSMKEFVALMSTGQVFSGKSDPVTVIQAGTEERIKQSVLLDFIDSGKHCIVSAGCEITPETSIKNMILFKKAAEALN